MSRGDWIFLTSLVVGSACIITFFAKVVMSPEAQRDRRERNERNAIANGYRLAPLPVVKDINHGVTIVEVEGHRFAVFSDGYGLAAVLLPPPPAERTKE